MSMKCNAYIDPLTKMALKGKSLKLAREVGRVEQCGKELNSDDVFCPRCGSRVSHFPRKASRSRPRTCKRDDETKASPCPKKPEPLPLAHTGIGKEVGEVMNVIRIGLTSIVVVIASIWGWGAFNAHDDVAHQRPMGRILKRMYGSEFNSISRHGYRMYINHFTTTDPDKETSWSDLGHAVENTWRETCEDVQSHFSGRNDKDRQEQLRLRERAADALGDAL